VGYWIGDRMEKVTNLIPLAVAMSFADIFSVYQGPSKEMAEQLQRFSVEEAELYERTMVEAGPAAAEQAIAAMRAPLSDYVIVHFPLVGTGSTIPLLGIGDFVVLAFLFRAAWVHGVSPVKTFVTALVSIVAALTIAQMLGSVIPALPFIALGTVGFLILTESRMRRPDRQEIILSIAVAALFIALIAGKWFYAVTSRPAA
jgi:hypothetical protein